MDLSVAMLEFAINSFDAGATRVVIKMRDGKRAYVKASDNGKGMDLATLKNACEKGYSGKGGSGLGLFKAAQAAKDHGGSLKIRSVQNKGTTVILRARGMEAGDIASSLAALLDNDTDIFLRAFIGSKRVKFDSKHARRKLGGMAIADPKAIVAIKKYINENLK